MFAMEGVLIILYWPKFEIFLAHARMLHRTQIVLLLFEWLGVEDAKFYICQHKICPEYLVFLLLDYVILDDFVVEWLDKGK